MIECQLITVADDPPVLILSYSCAVEIIDQENDITILLTPEYEPLLPGEERGASLSVGYDMDRSVILEAVRIEGNVVEFKAGPIHEKRDCRRVAPEEWRDSLEMLRRLSEGNAFSLESV